MTNNISDFKKPVIQGPSTPNSLDRRNNKRVGPKTFGWWLLAILPTVILVITVACSGNYGRLQYKKKVAQAFQHYERLDDYTYYFSGRLNKPTAIVGIDPAFEFSSRFWTAIGPDQFQTMVDRLSISNYGVLGGAYLIAPDGRKAGVWYSRVNTASVKLEGNRIIILFPDPSVRRF
jgi:hypothetical protein